MTTKQKPTAFISHASADKERFVRPFADALETHGISAWVDEREIQPGDRFAEKIHDALDKADAVVMVLSENSADSEWVKDEINAALVHRINKGAKGAKLLPVVLDGLPNQRIPPALHGIQQVRVDAGDYKGAAEKISRAIQGLPIAEKPPLATDAGMGISDQLARPIPLAHKLGVLLQRAESGNAEAQNALGIMYHGGEGIPQNHAEAAKWTRRAAKQGDAKAQFNLGLSYHKGEGVPQDDSEAVKWWHCAAEQKLPQAQSNLGVMYHEGKGVRQNHAEAAKWFRRAAGQGHAQAQSNLGIMYGEGGKGISLNHAEAAKWFRLAAEQGDAKAQYNLGVMYLEGKGVPQDDVEAVKWTRLAAEQGLPLAQSNLGAFYHKGKGVPQDDEEAAKWFRFAAE